MPFSLAPGYENSFWDPLIFTPYISSWFPDRLQSQFYFHSLGNRVLHLGTERGADVLWLSIPSGALISRWHLFGRLGHLDAAGVLKGQWLREWEGVQPAEAGIIELLGQLNAGVAPQDFHSVAAGAGETQAEVQILLDNKSPGKGI